MIMIDIQRLGKRYKRYARPTDRLLDWAGIPRSNEHWALRNVSLHARKGEAIGLIGANGAGKSTLLRIVNGTIRPTTGEIRVQGRVAALELGLGFHPEFTGRENCHVSGALTGFDRASLERLMPSIEEFAEIGAAIDEPVRSYSSGMQLRLAFSLATAVRPEVLMIDEVLAVGDAYFQQKCMARIREFRDAGTTLLLTSHDPAAIRALCDRAFLLDSGCIIREGIPSDVLEFYNAIIARQTADYQIRESERLAGVPGSMRSGDQRATIDEVDLEDDRGSTRAVPVGTPVAFRIGGVTNGEIQDITIGISIRDRFGNEVFGTNSRLLAAPTPSFRPRQRFRARFHLPLNLGVGMYALSVALHAGMAHTEGNYDWWDRALAFQVLPGREAPFVGCAFLPTTCQLETPDAEPVEIQ